MDEEFSFKKWLVICVIVIASISYIKNHYTFRDVLAYSKKSQDPKWSPKIDYYIGTYHFFRDNSDEALYAYNQLLRWCNTCQPYTPETLNRIGDIHKDHNRWELARVFYLRFMEEFPQHRNKDLVERKYEYIKFR